MFEFQSQGIDEAIKNLDDIEREQLPFALALAATRTAQDIQKAEKKLIAQTFDRPTKYTLNSVWIKSATKKNPTAAVWLKDDWSSGLGGNNAAEYLSPHIFGGPRTAKKFEKAMRRKGLLKLNQFVIPANSAKLDRFGNVSGGQIGKMLSNIGAQHDARQNSKITNKISYFLFENDDGSMSGIWRRTPNGIMPFMLFTNKAPTYQKRFPFFELANRIMSKRLTLNFNKAMDEALLSSITKRRAA